MRLSVVIPAYNEASRIQRTLDELTGSAGSAIVCEVIVVDDGSRDGTPERVEAFAAAGPDPARLRVIRSVAHRGKGACVRDGMLAASGEAILMTDADLSAPLSEINKLLPWIDAGYDVVIGSRRMPDSVLDPPQPLRRRMMERTFRALRRRILLPDILDTQCGFKLFTRRAARSVFPDVRTEGFAFDCEALQLARGRGFRIREVGIIWRNDPDSRVRTVRDSLSVLADLWRLRFRRD
ncbi:MAG: glycosyltransferase family 2 protein [Phycisphaerae bacterium]|nr:MAG: glycosyltransferase family 2 protein [Planctomycetota bacterium]KAB2949792.1 MAG: glycosyltransferase family 2 protein [Phycisphaerae bacterium]MBE7457002.1 glycosyltransferase family 2 protein [Planctomycetia bacterium]MCK6463639.1 glycosyltransferase family 2 protein [Phycisphaerae bacterium]MCL4718308.1 glycosyltransferase family 2 protein [Phycisphaerae bacterium]